jgi:predicted RNA-binding Zn-ribbon protein involved in translation (DUF1610 family)
MERKMLRRPLGIHKTDVGGHGTTRPGAGVKAMTTHVCTMKCPKCGSTATKPKPADQFKCEQCGWKL